MAAVKGKALPEAGPMGATPTAALDVRAEHEVFQRFAKLIERQNGVLISHRFSTVRMPSRTLVIENGQFVKINLYGDLPASGQGNR